MKNFASLIRTPFTTLLQTDYRSVTSNTTSFLSNAKLFLGLNLKKLKKFINKSPYLPFIIVIILVSIIAIFAINRVMSKSITQSGNTVDISKPIAQQILSKEFVYPLRDASDKEVSKITYEIQGAELRTEIIVKGQKATAVTGRAFLVINLKITNNYNKSIKINARDYLRFVVDDSPEKLAPDIHNDPVEVQAISTKPTRIGVAVNESDRNIVLQVGEIDGKKQSIKLDLK